MKKKEMEEIKEKIKRELNEQILARLLNYLDRKEFLYEKKKIKFLVATYFDEFESKLKQREAEVREENVMCLFFHNDEDGGQGMTIHTNGEDLKYFDMGLHGFHLTQDDLLDDKDKKSFANFCESYLKHYNQSLKQNTKGGD